MNSVSALIGSGEENELCLDDIGYSLVIHHFTTPMICSPSLQAESGVHNPQFSKVSLNGLRVNVV